MAMAQDTEQGVKQAVKAAIHYCQDVIGNIPTSKIKLEEVEHVDIKDEWNITLSWPEINEAMPIFTYAEKRQYKDFIVDASTFEIKAMKIRKI